MWSCTVRCRQDGGAHGWQVKIFYQNSLTIEFKDKNRFFELSFINQTFLCCAFYLLICWFMPWKMILQSAHGEPLWPAFVGHRPSSAVRQHFLHTHLLLFTVKSFPFVGQFISCLSWVGQSIKLRSQQLFNHFSNIKTIWYPWPSPMSSIHEIWCPRNIIILG